MMKQVEIKTIAPITPGGYIHPSRTTTGHADKRERPELFSREWVGDFKKPRRHFNALLANTSGIYEANIWRDMDMENREYIKVVLVPGTMNIHTISGSSQEAVDAVYNLLCE